jgi:hypothetical protein
LGISSEKNVPFIRISSLIYWLPVLTWGAVFSILFVLPYNVQYLGYDGTIHSYYAQLLFKQLVTGYPKAGQWDPHLYFGWGFLTIYPPLFSYLVAIAQFATPNAEKVVEILIFPLISVAYFLETRKICKDNLAGFIGSIFAFSVPGIIAVLVTDGTPDYLLTYACGALVFFYLYDAKIWNAALASIFLALVALSSLDNWLILTPYVVIFVATQQVSIKTRIVLALSPFLGFLLAGPYSFPAAIHFLKAPLTYNTTNFVTSPLLYLTSSQYPGVGAIGVSLVLIGTILFCMKFEKKYLPIFLVCWLALIAFFFPFKITILGYFVGKSGVYPLSLMVGPVAGYLVTNKQIRSSLSITNRFLRTYGKVLLAVVFVILCLSSTSFVQVNPSSPAQYSGLFQAVNFVNHLGGPVEVRNIIQSSNFSTSGGTWAFSDSTAVGGSITNETSFNFRTPAPIQNYSASVTITPTLGGNSSYLGVVLSNLNGSYIFARWLAPFQVFKLELERNGIFSPLGVFGLANRSFPMMINIVSFNDNSTFTVNGQHLESLHIGGIILFGLTAYKGDANFSNIRLFDLATTKSNDPLKFLLMPRGPIIGDLALMLNATSPDGWFDQGASNVTLDHMLLNATDVYSWNNGSKFIEVMQEIGVNYIFQD